MKQPTPPARYLRDEAPVELAFRFQDGGSARSLDEFRTRLRVLSFASVAFHRTHFAPWLRDVIGDDPLARRVEGYAESAPDPEVFREIVVELLGQRLDAR